jgi:pimeloyl-ACP methyl ester carboxylesterase
MPIITTGEGPVSFEESGAGDPIVLLHGIQGTARTWDAIVPLLNAHHRLVCPNLRGRADSHSPVDPQAYTLKGFASDLSAVMKPIAEPAIIVAWSMGVSVLLELLRQGHAEQIRALVLVSGTAFAGVEARWFHSTTLSGLEQEAQERAAKLHLVEAAHPHAVAAAWRHVQQADYRDLLPTIPYPTLVVHGSDDDQCPIAHGRFLAQQIPHAKMNEWKGCGHNPMAHDPRRFAGVITEFAHAVYGGIENKSSPQ